MNFHSVKAIYKFEMQRFFRTILQSFVSPVLSASLYFIVFGAAMGSRISQHPARGGQEPRVEGRHALLPSPLRGAGSGAEGAHADVDAGDGDRAEQATRAQVEPEQLRLRRAAGHVQPRPHCASRRLGQGAR